MTESAAAPGAAMRPDLATDLPGVLLGNLLTAAVFFGTAVLSFRLEPAIAPVAPAWPPAGFCLAALVLFGWRAMPGVLAGGLAVGAWLGEPLLASACAAAAHAAGAAAGHALIRRLAPACNLERVADVLVLAVAAPAAVALCSTAIGPTGLLLAGALQDRAFAGVATLWATGTLLGAVVFAPLVLAWRRPPARWKTGAGTIRAGIPALLAMLASALVFTGWLGGVVGQPAVAYVVIPFVVWTALAASPRWLTAVLATSVGFGLWAYAAGTGPFASAPPAAGLLTLHLFAIVCAASGLLVHALAAQGRDGERRAKLAAQRFEALARLSADWYWEQDTLGRFTRIAGRAAEEGRVDAARFLGRTRWEVGGPFDPEVRRRLDALVAAHQPFRDVLVERSEGGSAVPLAVSVSGEPVFDEAAHFVGYRGTGRDVTAEQQAEREIEASRRFLHAIVQAIPSPILVKDEALRYVAVNAAFEAFFGRPQDLILGRADADFFSPEQAAWFRETDQRALAGETVQYERAFALGGSERWMLARKSALTAPDGRRLVVLLLTDVTERRAVEQALRESEQRFRTVARLSSDWYWEQDEQLRFTFISSEGAQRDALPVSSVIGRTRHELDADFVPASARETHRRQLERREPFRDLLLRVRANGRLLLVNGQPVFTPGGRFTGYRGVARDFTVLHEAQRALEEQRQLLDALLGALPTPVSAKDASHRLVLVNDAFCALVGRSRDQLIGRDDRTYLVEADAQVLWDLDERALSQDQPIEHERAYTLPGGQRWILVRKSRLVRPDGTPLVLSVLSDISGLKAAESQLRTSERRFRDFADSAGEYAWETDTEGRLTFVSHRVKEVLMRDEDEVLGLRASDFLPPGEYERLLDWIRANAAEDGSFRDMEHRLVRGDGEVIWVSESAVRLRGEDGRPLGFRGTSRDITDRKAAEERISYLATRDALTGLPNRLLFNDRLEQGLVNARRKGESLALMFLDLDRFKTINDSLGHQVGDLMLKEVALRMQGCIRKGDTLSRLGGDEFVVTLEGLQHAEDAAQVAQKIIAALARPMEVGGHGLATSCSIGIAIFPTDADDAATLMRNADTAMYHAKEKGRRNYQFFSPEMNVRAVERHSLETALRRALERDELALAWQPRVDIATGRVSAVEALLRWHHPDRGLLSPAGFIDVAEESGLIEPIGRWVLRTACAQARTWAESGYPAVRISVNVSARQFSDPRRFSRAVTRALATTGLDPNLLELEMTESVLLRNASENIKALARLSRLGVHVAVDDFGTGYSSLSYLKQLPLDILKIDRSFVRDLETDRDSEAIVSAIIAMAHSLQLRVTAEGVERLGQLSALRRLGCDEYQGYLLSRPIPAQEFAMRFLAPTLLDFGS